MSRELTGDKRIDAIANRVIEKHFPDGKLNTILYTEALVKATVVECMKQFAFPVDIKSEITNNIVQAQWDHLARRFGLKDHDL